LPHDVFHDSTVVRVVTWGEPDRRLHFAAMLLAADLFTGQQAEDAVLPLHALLSSLPADLDWQMSRTELLERAFFTRPVEVDIQGKRVTLPLLAAPDDGSWLRVLIDTPLGWLEIFSPEMEPEDHREHLTPDQEAAGEAYLSLTPFPRLEGEREDLSDTPPGLPALRAVATEHDLLLEERPARIMFRAEKTQAFRAFVADARAALGLDEERPDVPAYVSGEPVVLADAAAFGIEAREDLVGLTLELQRIRPAYVWGAPNSGTVLGVERARLPYREALEASVNAVFAAFVNSPDHRVRLQLAVGRYRVGEHVLQITGPASCDVMTVEAYTAWRDKRPFGPAHSDTDWLNAPDPSALPRLVNPVEGFPPEFGWGLSSAAWV